MGCRDCNTQPSDLHDKELNILADMMSRMTLKQLVHLANDTRDAVEYARESVRSSDNEYRVGVTDHMDGIGIQLVRTTTDYAGAFHAGDAMFTVLGLADARKIRDQIHYLCDRRDGIV